jgi:endothelin-converting enzyme/putative endopeptidase
MRARLHLCTALLLATAQACLAGPHDLAASVAPGDNFYRYANDGWPAASPAGSDPASGGVSPMLAARNRERVRALLAEVQATPRTDDEKKVGDYYASLLANQQLDAQDLSATRRELKAIAAIRDRRALSAQLARHLTLDDGTDQRVDSLLGVWVHQGFHDPDHYSVHLVQGGLGLWEREAYLGNTPEQQQAREAYRARVARLLALAGLAEPQRAAGMVLALETEIAKVHATRADTDDVHKTDNAWRRADFPKLAPGLDWAVFFRSAGLAGADRFTVWQPGAVKDMSALVASQPLAAWKAYAAFHLLAHDAPVLPRPYRDEAEGAREALALAMTNQALGDALAKAYVARHFPPQSKAAAQAMVAHIRTAFVPRISGLNWLSDMGKAMALRKLKALELGLGYPDSWTDYTRLQVVRGDALGNLHRAEAFAWARNLAKLKEAVNPAEWALAPQSTGAILNFSPNSMQFASGLFQPPYFDPLGDLASNYGSAGAGLAHEVSHSFDELGNDYDERGNLAHWWSAADHANYQAAGASLALQIAAECPLPGVCVSSQRTLGESIADLAGLHAAHDAYLAALGGKPDTVVNGLSGEQRFFIAFARRWHKSLSDEALKKHIASDSHLPPEARANAVRQLDAWYKAFDIKPGDKLYLPPEQRTRIW